ncbi:MAG: hypothetical protein JOZ31_19465 [Verrucomicrobia bacterium]|nr:hypothetical protein [Verrucomicrobiota bacterium]MBV8482507.1 hypothetical protein [Verrucomicrobiota bacterium]
MKRTPRIEFLLAISICALLPGWGIAQSGSSGSGPLRPEARGIYCLTQAEGIQHVDLANLNCWDNPNIVGVAIRVTWSVMEQSTGQYDWSYLEEALRIARSKKKLIAVSVVAGIRSPDWVFGSATILRLTGKAAKHRDTVPAPWDANYLSAWKKFVQAFGARYDGNPLIGYVTATGLGRGEECHLLDDPNDAWQFDANRWLAASNQVISCYHSAFRTTPWVLAWGQPALHQNHLMADLYTESGGFGFKADNLFVFFPNPGVPLGRLALRMSRSRAVVFQALRPAHDPYTLDAVIENGRRMGMQAFECYQNDVSDPACQAVLAAANRAMGAR